MSPGDWLVMLFLFDALVLLRLRSRMQQAADYAHSAAMANLAAINAVNARVDTLQRMLERMRDAGR